ncbi:MULTISPECIES: universal stress protein [Thermodesulfovibrio]|jgi:nucleotide-binding universal stress UspA family protein|uniref:Universal stress protein family n=1 Tax=Thermodesulfovibrio yellowstonii (strain ATCC 51303 / DSM 11347 / YP87) TaxID=289376 RepID=B5YK09_THEYD|nr:MULTISPECIES: universal stress protein [Thermodesulfovibrio]ACI20584.1 universal stress protein family [Thermodesulfovibrio yellowstonii DSM 11347]
MINCPFEKVLLPVDRSENSLRAIKFAGALLSGVDSSEVTLLYVMTGGYLSERMKNIDFRAELIKETQTFKKIREKHIEENIIPFLTEYEDNLKKSGFKGTLSKLVEEGEAGNKIIEVATREKFQTVIMARRGMSEWKGYILGSVSNKVIHGLLNQNIYIVGQKITENPLSHILLPVDGSEYSMKAVQHAACLAKQVKAIQKITILRVINVSLYLERVRQGIDPEAEAEETLSKAKKILTDEGVETGLIETKSVVGFPKDEIIKEVQEFGYNLVIMGRKGRSAIKDIVLGGVSSSVLNNCFEQTIAIINQ